MTYTDLPGGGFRRSYTGAELRRMWVGDDDRTIGDYLSYIFDAITDDDPLNRGHAVAILVETLTAAPCFMCDGTGRCRPNNDYCPLDDACHFCDGSGTPGAWETTTPQQEPIR